MLSIHRSKWIVAGCLLTAPLCAQETAPQELTTTLDTFVVEGVPDELSIMPTSRSVGSMFGDSRSIMETPRSVSLLTKEMLELRGIDKVEDLGLYSPGVFSPSVFGVPGVPTIRGAFAEMLQNGQRRRFQRLSYSPSFSTIDTLDIIKGTANVIYGPVTRGGGMVNINTKMPNFNETINEVTIKLGDLVLSDKGSSYSKIQATFDSTGPLNDKLAYRVVIGGREADSWYRNVNDDMREVYFALSWRPTDKVTWDVNFTWEDYDNNEALGINRVTQELIDHGTYVAGPATAYYANEEAVVDGATAHKVHLDGNETLTSPDAGGQATHVVLQSILKLEINDDLTFKNSTMYEYLDARKFSPHSYSNYMPESHMIDNRAEFVLSKDLPAGMSSQTTFGGAYRYDQAETYSDYNDEVFAVYDLTADPSTFTNPSFPNFYVANGSNGFIPGEGSNYRSQISTARKSTLQQYGIFLQEEVKVHPMLSLLGGLRYDYTTLEAERPTLLDLSGNPIASTGPSTRAEAEVTTPSYNGSVILTPKSWWSLYFTYNYVENARGDDFNAFAPIDASTSTPGFQPKINKNDLREENVLYELGTRFSLIDRKLYIAASGFRQNRSYNNARTGVSVPIRVHGTELEITYQPTTRFSVYANASYTISKQPNFDPDGTLGTKNYLDAFDPSITVDGKSGTGVGSPNYGTNQYAPGTWKNWATPDTIVNFGATYMVTKALGTTANVQFIKSYNLNADGSLVIPDSFETDFSIFYRRKRWEVKLDLSNVFDERIITPVSAGSANDLIMVQPPRRLSATFKYRF
jgi:iron complex outermembrane recepter protein